MVIEAEYMIIATIWELTWLDRNSQITTQMELPILDDNYQGIK